LFNCMLNMLQPTNCQPINCQPEKIINKKNINRHFWPTVYNMEVKQQGDQEEMEYMPLVEAYSRDSTDGQAQDLFRRSEATLAYPTLQLLSTTSLPDKVNRSRPDPMAKASVLLFVEHSFMRLCIYIYIFWFC